ncbi:MAG: tetratricopeptide repeat protein [Planctomycetia bacterium]|nr:tetratricopeptide repeat protein [Planctomycetia bacterium]
MSSAAPNLNSSSLSGQRVALVGKLAGMSRRDAQKLVREQGGIAVEEALGADLIVVGESELPLDDTLGGAALFDDAIRTAADEGRLAIIGETELWRRLGLVDDSLDVRRLYTPAMLAELLRVPVAVIRRWHRRGLIVPVREVRRLPYFSFQEVATARSLARLVEGGIAPGALEKKLTALARFVPSAERRLAQLSVIVEGKQLLLRQGEGLIDAGGQLRFDFESEAPAAISDFRFQISDLEEQNNSTSIRNSQSSIPNSPSSSIDPREIVSAAADLEDAGRLAEAADMYRTALVVGGPSADVNFWLAELLYRSGDVAGARERYYMAIELNEDLVEARANLGCVLSETGQLELALAAFEGALAFHPDYADAHYHLARTLDELNRQSEASTHWRAFVALAPDSPWADEARTRLADEPSAE